MYCAEKRIMLNHINEIPLYTQIDYINNAVTVREQFQEIMAISLL